MTKQEEIKGKIKSFRCIVCREFDFCDRTECDDDLDKLIQELDELGLVLKVEREGSPTLMPLVAFEPLIKVISG